MSNQNANKMRDFLKNGKSNSNKQSFNPITNKKDKKLTSHRKLGK